MTEGGECDRSPYYAELWKRFARFAADNEWWDTMSSFYTPKQNLYRKMRGGDWADRRHRERLGFAPSSFEEMDLMLAARGYCRKARPTSWTGRRRGARS